MREIKFRAWDKQTKKMWYSDGTPLSMKVTFTPSCIFCQGKSGYDPSADNLMQYTGLKDKNGKEIYEGDIVKYHDDFYSDPADIGGKKHIVRDRLYIIWWHPLKAAFWLKSIPEAITEPLLSLDCEIIGNIYEDSHLLEVKERK